MLEVLIALGFCFLAFSLNNVRIHFLRQRNKLIWVFPVQVRCNKVLLHLIGLTSVFLSSHHLFLVPCLSPTLNDISIIIHLFYLIMWKQSESNLRFLFNFWSSYCLKVGVSHRECVFKLFSLKLPIQKIYLFFTEG